MIHRTEYDEFHEPVNMLRIFGNDVLVDYTPTLQKLRDAVKALEWTDILDKLFEAILETELSPAGYADVEGLSPVDAQQEYDHAYRALKQMVGMWQIAPVTL